MSPNMCSKALFLLSSLSTIYSPFVQATNTIDTNCPLLGPVYPAPTQIRSSAAVKFGQKAFEDGVRQAFATGVIDNATTSFSLRAFSASETESLFDLHYEAPGLNGSLTAGSLNADTVYRIGSLTKLVTAYAMLEQFGFGPLLDSITKHIPELAAAAKKNDPLAVSWNDVTIEALMSHMAGIARDYFANKQNLSIGKLGLPKLKEAEIPKCGLGNNLTLCSRKEYLAGITAGHPVGATHGTPVYSNEAYALLGYAIEEMSGLSYEEFIQKSLVTPLKLSRTTFKAPKIFENSIIPVDPATSYFAADAGYENPIGGAYSTLNDVTKLGQSILQSQLLPAPVTRQWMKPRTHTSNPLMSVGAPWEISRMVVPLSKHSRNTRLVDLYAKSGDIGAYSSLLILDPDHNTGFSIITAGLKSHATVVGLADLLTSSFIPAFEEAAAEAAAQSYTGDYSTGSGNHVSNMTIVVDPKRPGLGVTSWFSNGADMFAMLKALAGVMDPSVTYSVRLYPNGISYKNKVAFRALFERLPKVVDNNAFSTNCLTWVDVDQIKYGNVALDDFVFELGTDGKVEALDVLGLRERLAKA